MQRPPAEPSGTTTTAGIPEDVVCHTILSQVSSEWWEGKGSVPEPHLPSTKAKPVGHAIHSGQQQELLSCSSANGTITKNFFFSYSILGEQMRRALL